MANSVTRTFILAMILFLVGISLSAQPKYMEKKKYAKYSEVLSVGDENVENQFARSAKKVPPEYSIGVGFYSFAKADPDVLWRSGQPLIDEFVWLEKEGCKSIIDLRKDGEYGEVTIDILISGFKETGFKFFSIPIPDSEVPKEKQVVEFLTLIQKPEFQPALIHCRSGVGRTSLFTAVYRYSIQGWSMRKAIEESRNFKNGVNEAQYHFLCKWAKKYPPGSFKIGLTNN